jgi:NAD-dependent deacetylase
MGGGGLWDTVDVKGYATAAAMEADPALVWNFFHQVRAQIAAAVPNAGHLAIADAERRLGSGQTLTVLTQNVDGLHSLAGSTRVVELHGTLRRSRCTRCNFARLEDLSACPQCPQCAAPMRPAVALFDEALPVDAEWESKKSLRECDLFIAVGTSGTVSPASNFVRAAEHAGARTHLRQPGADDTEQSCLSRGAARPRRGTTATAARRVPGYHDEPLKATGPVSGRFG